MRTLALPGRSFAAPKRFSRLLFSWEARDLSLTARSGQVGTFSRASTGTAIDANGVLCPCVHSQPRFGWFDLDSDGVRETVTLVLEDTRTNLLLRSQEFDNAAWTQVNVTVTANAVAAPDGTTTADKLAATATAATTNKQTVAVAATVASGSVYVKQGSSATAANGFALSDATSATGLVAFTVNYGTGAITYTTGSSGAVVEKFANGWWRVSASASGITSGHNIAFYAGFTGGSATAGDYCYLWGGQLEAAIAPSTYIPTTTASAARSAEALSFPLNVPPRAMTVYVKLLERGTALLASANGVLGIGASVAPALFLVGDGSGHYRFEHRNGSDLSSTAAAAPAFNNAVELRGIVNSDGSVQLGQSINGAAEVVAAATAANALATAWNNTTLLVNDWSGSAAGYTAIVAIRIAAGIQSLSTMRAFG